VKIDPQGEPIKAQHSDYSIGLLLGAGMPHRGHLSDFRKSLHNCLPQIEGHLGWPLQTELHRSLR